MTGEDVARELSALAIFYGVPDHFIGALAPWLGSYAELVLAETGFEILTGGKGKGCAQDLAKAAAGFDASASSIDRFLMCDATFPDRMLGLKVDVGAGGSTSVTLYIRLLAELPTALTFLQRIGCAPVGFAECLSPARTVYGLGFFSRGAEAGLKTYTVTDLTDAPFRAVLGDLNLSWPRPGFISHRVADDVVLHETKVYLPDVDVSALSALSATTPRWREILSFMPSLLTADTCTVGISARPSAPPEMKLYIERVGAVPNDFSAR